MDGKQAYEQQHSRSWARIDMLLALYEYGIRTAAAGVEAVRSGNDQQLAHHRCKMQRVIVELLDGLDMSVTETSEPIQRLLHFIASSVTTDSPKNWEACRSILESLRDGFQQVRDDAVRFEEESTLTEHHARQSQSVSTLA